MLQSNFRNKREFISSCDIQNVNLDINYDTKENIKITIKEMFKEPTKKVQNTLEMLNIHDIEFKLKNSRGESRRIFYLRRIKLRKNIEFLKNLENIDFKILGIGEKDEIITSLIQNTYLLVNFEDFCIEIPHNFHEYIYCIDTIKKTILQVSKQDDEVKISPIAPKGQNQGRQKTLFKFLKKKFFVSFNNLNLKIEDDERETRLIRFNRFIKTYLSKELNYDEKTILYHLNTLKQLCPSLIEFRISELVLDLRDAFDDERRDILTQKARTFLEGCDEHSAFFEFSDMREILHLKIKVYAHNLAVSLRDYPLEVIKIRFLSFETQALLVKLKPGRFLTGGYDYGSTKIYYNSNVFIDEPTFNLGLNLYFAIKSVSEWLIKITGEINELMSDYDPQLKRNEKKADGKAELNTFIQNFKTKFMTSESDLKRLKSWDKLRFKLHGRFRLRINNLRIRILTGLSPYNIDCLELSFKTFYVDHFEPELKLLLSDLFLKRLLQDREENKPLHIEPKDQTAILKFPRFELVIRWDWNPSELRYNHYFLSNSKFDQDAPRLFISNGLSLELRVNIPEVDADEQYNNLADTRMLVQRSPVPIVHFQANLFNELVTLPQLSHQYLSLIGINPNKYSKFSKFSKISKIRNFFELFYLPKQGQPGRSGQLVDDL